MTFFEKKLINLVIRAEKENQLNRIKALNNIFSKVENVESYENIAFLNLTNFMYKNLNKTGGKDKI